MTQITYTVINRPKKGKPGITQIGWSEECGREAVPYGGYLITNRTPKGASKKYIGMLVERDEDGDYGDEQIVGIAFETRATAAFAIWRKYYEGWRAERRAESDREEAIQAEKRRARAHNRLARQTPEGKEAYRLDLNAKARARRAQMTDEEKVADAAKRRAKREHENFVSTYTDE